MLCQKTIETPVLKPIYSLRIPNGLPCANKLLQSPVSWNNNNPSNAAPSNQQTNILTLHSDTKATNIQSTNYSDAINQSSGGNDLISTAILQAYKHRSAKGAIAVPDHLIQELNDGPQASKKLAIYFSPSSAQCSAHLIEYNDKCGKHPLSKLKKTEMSLADRNKLRSSLNVLRNSSYLQVQYQETVLRHFRLRLQGLVKLHIESKLI